MNYTAPIRHELEACTQMIAADLNHSNPLLNMALQTIKSRSGKMMRPTLTLLSAQLFAPIADEALHAAVAYEMFHTASLVHDDVVDESEQRRGHDSINHSHGNKVAVLVGDYILSITLRHIAATRNPRLIDIMSRAAGKLASGELLQMQGTHSSSLNEATYTEIISCKTAALFAACATSGAIVAGANEDNIQLMTRYGELVGLCFQIKDDLLDYSDLDIGKPTGSDLAEGKLTLPIIYALQQKPDVFQPIVDAIHSAGATPTLITEAIAATRQAGGIDYATQVMHRYAAEACQLLAPLPDSPTKQALIEFVERVVKRNK